MNVCSVLRIDAGIKTKSPRMLLLPCKTTLPNKHFGD